MRGHRFFLVLTAVVAVGLVGLAGYDRGRDAVSDSEAAQLVGGATAWCAYSGLTNCSAPCVGNCYSGPGSVYIGSNTAPCGNNSSCACLYQAGCDTPPP